jgi:hypothetical protein
MGRVIDSSGPTSRIDENQSELFESCNNGGVIAVDPLALGCHLHSRSYMKPPQRRLELNPVRGHAIFGPQQLFRKKTKKSLLYKYKPPLPLKWKRTTQFASLFFFQAIGYFLCFKAQFGLKLHQVLKFCGPRRLNLGLLRVVALRLSLGHIWMYRPTKGCSVLLEPKSSALLIEPYRFQ